MVIRFNYQGLVGPSMAEAPTRYDGLLAAMPASVAGGALAGWLLAIPMAVGVGAGSALASVFVAASLFVVPPE